MFKQVDKEAYLAFIRDIPRRLVGDVTAICEPPLETINDFSDGKVWPESVVAKCVRHADSYPEPDGSKRPNEYWVLDTL